jgi:hypothetical protein
MSRRQPGGELLAALRRCGPRRNQHKNHPHGELFVQVWVGQMGALLTRCTCTWLDCVGSRSPFHTGTERTGQITLSWPHMMRALAGCPTRFEMQFCSHTGRLSISHDTAVLLGYRIGTRIRTIPAMPLGSVLCIKSVVTRIDGSSSSPSSTKVRELPACEMCRAPTIMA